MWMSDSRLFKLRNLQDVLHLFQSTHHTDLHPTSPDNGRYKSNPYIVIASTCIHLPPTSPTPFSTSTHFLSQHRLHFSMTSELPNRCRIVRREDVNLADAFENHRLAEITSPAQVDAVLSAEEVDGTHSTSERISSNPQSSGWWHVPEPEPEKEPGPVVSTVFGLEEVKFSMEPFCLAEDCGIALEGGGRLAFSLAETVWTLRRREAAGLPSWTRRWMQSSFLA